MIKNDIMFKIFTTFIIIIGIFYSCWFYSCNMLLYAFTGPKGDPGINGTIGVPGYNGTKGEMNGIVTIW